MLQGQGERVYSSGGKYVGEFEQNKRHGKGSFYNADGSVFNGQFVHDVPTGRCTVVQSDGTVVNLVYNNKGRIVQSVDEVPEADA